MEKRAGARTELIDGARAALRAGDAAGARALLEEVCADCPDDPHVHECLARAAYLQLDFPAAAEHWQRAYAAFRLEGDCRGEALLDSARLLRTTLLRRDHGGQ